MFFEQLVEFGQKPLMLSQLVIKHNFTEISKHKNTFFRGSLFGKVLPRHLFGSSRALRLSGCLCEGLDFLGEESAVVFVEHSIKDAHPDPLVDLAREGLLCESAYLGLALAGKFIAERHFN